MRFVAAYLVFGVVSAVLWCSFTPAKERWSPGIAVWNIVAGGLFWPLAALFLGMELWAEEFMLALTFAILAVCITVGLVALALHA